MIGQNPDAYGVPELNLFTAETMDDFVAECGGYKQIQLHGLLRTVAQLCAGEQSLNSVEMARRWLARRLKRTTSDVYRELCDMVAPLRIVDKSPPYSHKRSTLDTIYATFPQARFIHLVRNPRAQGESMMEVANGLMAVLVNSIDYGTTPPTIDPQISWVEVQRTILDFLQTVPPRQSMRLRGEDALQHPEEKLAEIARWAGLADDNLAVEAMMHPERSPYASLGPFGAHLGNDINFLRSPAYRPGAVRNPALHGPLPWRPDGASLREEAVELARSFGYEP
jgi:Sulfotransferase family